MYPRHPRLRSAPGRRAPTAGTAVPTRQCRPRSTQIVSRIVSEKREGDILIFLPGEKAIKECMKRLAFGPSGSRLHIIPLYSRLGKDEQERVFEKAPLFRTKVVISTNIAETSVTIDGITSVIDSGLAKLNYYNPQDLHLEPHRDADLQGFLQPAQGEGGAYPAGQLLSPLLEGRFREPAALHHGGDISHRSHRGRAPDGRARDQRSSSASSSSPRPPSRASPARSTRSASSTPSIRTGASPRSAR